MLSELLRNARKNAGLTQKQLGDKCGVSRQSVQKWETGVSRPDLCRLTILSQELGLSLAQLTNEQPTTDSGSYLQQPAFTEPEYASAYPQETYGNTFNLEFYQTFDEGYDIVDLKDLMNCIQALAPSRAKDRLADVVFDMIHSRPRRADYTYCELNAYEYIKALAGHSAVVPVKRDSVLTDKIKGAWLGRVIGCVLGKSLGGVRLSQLIGLLKDLGNYPLRRYLRFCDIPEKYLEDDRYPLKSHRRLFPDQFENGVPPDDDLNYTVLAAWIVSNYGPEFTPAQVGSAWIELLPKRVCAGSCRVAYINLVRGIEPPQSALYKNPYREWIGAQIRADFYGYINPGNPIKAAEMAWRDASISHVKNGLYGAMFIAAILAAAAAETNVQTLIEIALREIPLTSRLYAAITMILHDKQNGMSFEEAVAKHHQMYDDRSDYIRYHTVPNASIVCIALLYAQDFASAVGNAVQCGFATDCNGATVGSIYGMMHGAGSIPGEFIAPIGDIINTNVYGMQKVSITDLCKLTLDCIKACK